MTKPMVRIHNTETDQVIDREMTAAEFKQYEVEKKHIADQIAEVEAKASARTELLKRLGITVEEAKLLLS